MEFATFATVSALAHVLLGQLKTCLVLLMGVMLFDQRPKMVGIAGATGAVVSITIYTLLKLEESKGVSSPGQGFAREPQPGRSPQDSDVDAEGTPLTAAHVEAVQQTR